MRTATLWARWLGERVHPLRLVVESALACVGLWPIATLAWVFAERLGYPIDLEWCEGGSLYQAYRLLHGYPIYSLDDPNWAPFPYPPLHTLALAIIGLVRLNFSSGRLLSVACFALLCTTLYREIYKHLGKSSFGAAAGLLTVGTIACGFPVIGQFYDLVRVDTMMLALSVLGVARIYDANNRPIHLLSTAAILCAAVFTKQTAIFFVGWAGLFALIFRPRYGLRLAVVSGLLALVLLGAAQWITHGGMWFWTVAGIRNHAFEDARVMVGMRQVLNFAPYIAALPFAVLLLAVRGSLSPRTALWCGCLIVALPASLLPFAKVGGYDNNLMPLVILAGPVATMVAADLAKQNGRVAGALARWGLLVGLALFLWSRPLTPKSYLPDAQKVRAAAELNAIVASLTGGLVVPYLAFLPGHNGHDNPHWHSMVVWDAQWREQPMNEVKALENSKARWVLLHSKDVGEFANYVRRTSRLAQRIPDSARVRMVTGAAVEIDELWERNGFADAH